MADFGKVAVMMGGAVLTRCLRSRPVREGTPAAAQHTSAMGDDHG